MDFVINKLSLKQQTLSKILAHCSALLFSIAVLIVGGVNLVELTLVPVQRSAALGIKMAYVYAVLPISGLLMAFAALAHLQHCNSTCSDNKEH